MGMNASMVRSSGSSFLRSFRSNPTSQPSRCTNHLYTIVPGIENEHAVMGRRNSPGVLQFAGFSAHPAINAQALSGRFKPLNSIVAELRHQQRAILEHLQAIWI